MLQLMFLMNDLTEPVQILCVAGSGLAISFGRIGDRIYLHTRTLFLYLRNDVTDCFSILVGG